MLLHQPGHTVEPIDPGLAELAGDLEVLNFYWEDGYDNPESIKEEICQACRNLLDGPPFAPVFPRSDSPSIIVGSMVVNGPRRAGRKPISGGAGMRSARGRMRSGYCRLRCVTIQGERAHRRICGPPTDLGSCGRTGTSAAPRRPARPS